MNQPISQHHYVDPMSGALIFFEAPGEDAQKLARATAHALLKLSDHIRFEQHILLPADVRQALDDLRYLLGVS